MNLKRSFSTICILFTLVGCSGQSEIHPYTLEQRFGGIYVETYDSTITDKNRYTENNVIYEALDSYYFDYAYIDKEGKRFKMQREAGANSLEYEQLKRAWFLVPEEDRTEERIETIQLQVQKGLSPFDQWMPDYYQTVMLYYYSAANGDQVFNEATGIVENEKNIWAHPPRQFLFMILELNPFPYIQAPFEIGNSWDWTLDIGNGYQDARWATWDSVITNNYIYEITGEERIETKAGTFDTYIVESTAQSTVGTSHLKAYFSEEAGFVKLDYTNVDSTRMELELIEISKAQE